MLLLEHKEMELLIQKTKVGQNNADFCNQKKAFVVPFEVKH